MPVVPGEVLAGKYQVERVLGQGAMGVVVAARHLDLGELFAIKLLLPQAFAFPDAIERFVREARASARLKGDHVVKVIDVGRLPNALPYMVMEHLSGTDLQKHVRAAGPLPVSEAVQYMLEACDAISEAHALGIVHRDLKPSNLFLARRPNGTTSLKVLDFGISKQLSQEAVDLTKTGEIFGTPLYMAPEQMSGMKAADIRADIWAMGIVFYELLTGTSPFHATTVTQVVARVLQEDPAPPSHVRPGLPPAIDAFILRCLQKRPELRFQRIEELIAGLRALAAAPGDPAMARSSSPNVPPTLEAIHAAPVASTASAWGATGRHRQGKGGGLLWALAIGGTLAAALATVVLWLALRSPRESALASSSEPARATPPVLAPPPVATAEPSSTAADPTTSSPVATSTSTASNAAPPTSSSVSTTKPGTIKPAPTSQPAEPSRRFGGIH